MCRLLHVSRLFNLSFTLTLNPHVAFLELLNICACSKKASWRGSTNTRKRAESEILISKLPKEEKADTYAEYVSVE